MSAAGGTRPSRPGASPAGLPVRALLEDVGLDGDAPHPGIGLALDLVAGARGLDRTIEHPRIQKSGLALVGHFHGIVPTRIQILGQTELSYLAGLGGAERRASLRGFFDLGLSCVIATLGLASAPRASRSGAVMRGATPPQPDLDLDSTGQGTLPVPELRDLADETATPLLVSTERSSATISALHALLDDRLAPRVRLHGVLVDVFGVGLLLMGSSGIGKSECALDLVMRGHRLVADDVVECDYRPPGMVFGAPADLLRHHLEVRGLGILNIKDLYGVTSIRERKRIDVVVRLSEWSPDAEYDRLGLDEHVREILGVVIRELQIPVRPGRDMASILEVAARNELLRSSGHDGARDFFGQLEGSLVSEHTHVPSVPPTSARVSLDDESAMPPPVQRKAPAPPPFTRGDPAPPVPPPAAPPGAASPASTRSLHRGPESSVSIPRPMKRQP